jgi:hypothetical protein
MSVGTDLNGIFSQTQLEQLKGPTAWPATMTESEATTEDSAMYALVDEALEEIEEAYFHRGSFDELAVRLEDGKVVEIVEVRE